MKLISIYNKFILKTKFKTQSSIFTHLTIDEKVKIMKLSTKVNGNYVEIGSYLGASSCFICEGIKKTKSKSKLYCVDTWNNDAMSEGKKDTYNIFLDNIKLYKDIIVPLRGYSTEMAKEVTGKIDFMFFDGDHSYEGIKSDVRTWLPKLHSGSMVVFHDIGWAEGVQKVIKEDIKPIIKNEGRLPNLYWGQIR